MPIPEITRSLLLPKPRMSYLINRPLTSGIITGHRDRQDSRIINPGLTGKDKTPLQAYRQPRKSNLN